MSPQERQRPGERGLSATREGAEQMEARQMTIHEWTVVSYRNGATTAHTVNLHELTCSCEDYQYNVEGAEICDHIALANHYADRTMDVKAALDHEMRSQMLELERISRQLERRASGLEAEQAAADSAGDSGGSQPTADEWDGNPVEATKSLLRDAGWPVDQLEIWVHEDLGSVQIDNQIRDDGEWDEFNDWAYNQGFLGYDRDDYINYIKPSLFPEVFG